MQLYFVFGSKPVQFSIQAKPEQQHFFVVKKLGIKTQKKQIKLNLQVGPRWRILIDSTIILKSCWESFFFSVMLTFLLNWEWRTCNWLLLNVCCVFTACKRITLLWASWCSSCVSAAQSRLGNPDDSQHEQRSLYSLCQLAWRMQP